MPSLESLLAPALAGEPSAVRALVAAFTPVIEARASRALARKGSRQRDPQRELEALAEDVLLLLFRDDARVLRVWTANPRMARPDLHLEREGGLSLLDYVARVAERAGESAQDRDHSLAEAPESEAGPRDLFDHLHARLAEEQHPRAMEMYRLLVIEDVPIDEVCERTGLSVDAVQAARSRFLKRARQLLGELRALFASESARLRAVPVRSCR